MTEQMWHLKMCQLCPWTILEKKQTRLTQTLLSSWLQSLVSIFLWILVCNVIFPSLSLSDLSCENFPISSANDGKARAKLLFWVTWSVTETLTPTPTGVFSVNLRRQHVQATALAYGHKSLKRAHFPPHDQTTGHDWASYFCLVNTSSSHFYLKYSWEDAA